MRVGERFVAGPVGTGLLMMAPGALSADQKVWSPVRPLPSISLAL